MLTGRRLGGTPCMLRPPISMSPLSGPMKPAIIRNKVVLPQPEGPRMEKKLPRFTAKDKESTATWLPKRFSSDLASRSTAVTSQP